MALKYTDLRSTQIKRSSFTEEQIAHVLRQAESGVPVQELIRKTGITEQTFYRWKRKFGGMGVWSYDDYGCSKKKTANSNNLSLTSLWTNTCSRRCEPREVISKKL